MCFNQKNIYAHWSEESYGFWFYQWYTNGTPVRKGFVKHLNRNDHSNKKSKTIDDENMSSTQIQPVTLTHFISLIQMFACLDQQH